MDDVVIVGGSFAGLAAALLLGRARRKVTVLDTGLPRNRYASHAHNLLGHDGKPPRQILDESRAQLAAYPTVTLLDARGESLKGVADDFTVGNSKGDVRARRVLLSYGITDLFPDIPGFAECWGRTVIHCPFCHGFEIAEKRWGVIYSTPMSLHAPGLYSNWTDDITLFSDGHDIPEAERSKLAKRNVRVVDGRVRAMEHRDGQLTAVVSETEGAVPLDAVYAHPRVRPSADLHEAAGIETWETPFGLAIKVDENQKTNVDGIYAAGDLTAAMHSLPLAITAGMMAGMHAFRSLGD
jgi:thioredoxin reductase